MNTAIKTDLPRLKHGRALVISGPQGSGKSRLALQIAKQHTSSHINLQPEELDTPYIETLLEMLVDKRVLILEGPPTTQRAMANLKYLITTKQAHCRHHHTNTVTEFKPPLIVITTNEPMTQAGVDTRRFDFIELDHQGRVLSLH